VHAFEYPTVLGRRGHPADTITSEEQAARDLRIREEAIRDTEQRIRQELAASLDDERMYIQEAVRAFTSDCDTYYRRVEAEVVQLALAIARRILHREAEIDPLILAGVVRVALDNLRAATDLKLHVRPAEGAAWRKLFGQESHANYQVTIVDEPMFAPGQCRLESSLGTVELGVDDQLKEIEQGFLDLLAARPR
jgi:flagellar assembly protein FliH